MVHPRSETPQGHGELLTQPALASWPALLERNAALRVGWEFEVGGMAAQAFCREAREECTAAAAAFSQRAGVRFSPPREDAPIVMTGHQPELYHPGVWVKVFLVDRIAQQQGATGIDCVVDSDAFDRVALSVPRIGTTIERQDVVLAEGGPDVCYALADVPEADAVERFRREGLALLGDLPAHAPARHFEEYCSCLRDSIPGCDTLGELMTVARRRYEEPAQTRYLELLVSDQGTTRAFRRFVAHLARDVAQFAAVHNDVLATYRRTSGTRSAVRPFPDLAVDGDFVELPLWHLEGRARSRVFVDRESGQLRAGRTVLAHVSDDPDMTIAALEGVGLAPRAVALTLFNRMFVADLFVHGVGGSRYDRVTDEIIRRYFGVEPLGYAVASLTMVLPLGNRIVSASDLAEAEERLHRLEHNPDQLLGEVEFDSVQERERADALAAEKERLVAAIGAVGADRKALGRRIRQVNAALAETLAPLEQQLRSELERARAEARAADVLRDRTYPFCLWSPVEVQDKAR